MLHIDGVSYEPSVIDHIWHRRPEELKDSRFDDSAESKYTQAEWAEFIENFFAHVPKERWINHPSCNAAASRKLEQLTIAKRFGFQVPNTLVTQNPKALKEFYNAHRNGVIAKPISTGYLERAEGEDDSLIYTNLLGDEDLSALEDLSACPTFFQEFISKQIDIRITVLDSAIHAVALSAKDHKGTQRCDIRRNNMADVTYSPIELPNDVRGALLRLVQHYELRFAAIDMALSTEGVWYFFEINPNGQWAWLDEVAGANIANSFLETFAFSSNSTRHAQ